MRSSATGQRIAEGMRVKPLVEAEKARAERRWEWRLLYSIWKDFHLDVTAFSN